jgi:hypothetical protein
VFFCYLVVQLVSWGGAMRHTITTLDDDDSGFPVVSVRACFFSSSASYL